MLAQATGIYRERPVSGLLRNHFACAWLHRLPATGAEPILVVPDGSIDLQWVDGVLHIAGPDREPHTEARAPGAIVVGFRFRPGHAAEWLGLPRPSCSTAVFPGRNLGSRGEPGWRRRWVELLASPTSCSGWNTAWCSALPAERRAAGIRRPIGS